MYRLFHAGRMLSQYLMLDIALATSSYVLLSRLCLTVIEGDWVEVSKYTTPI